MRNLFEGKRRDEFWTLVAARGVSLINDAECEESDVSVEEAANVRVLPFIFSFGAWNNVWVCILCACCGDMRGTAAFVSYIVKFHSAPAEEMQVEAEPAAAEEDDEDDLFGMVE